MECFRVAQLNFRIKGQHVYGYKYIVNEELACTIDDTDQRNSNTIKVCFVMMKKRANAM